MSVSGKKHMNHVKLPGREDMGCWGVTLGSFAFCASAHAASLLGCTSSKWLAKWVGMFKKPYSHGHNNHSHNNKHHHSHHSAATQSFLILSPWSSMLDWNLIVYVSTCFHARKTETSTSQQFLLLSNLTDNMCRAPSLPLGLALCFFCRGIVQRHKRTDSFCCFFFLGTSQKATYHHSLHS